MDDVSDHGVWEQVLAGDSRRFGVIWDRHRDRVFRHVLSHGLAPADAEDLTAVTFLELWRRRLSVRFVDGSLLPWILVTATNVTRNAQRSLRRHRALLAKLPPPAPASDHAEIYAERDTERAARTREVLSAARAEDRHLAMLTGLEGFTVREAAQAIGISESAAKMRLSRLRKKLIDTTAPSFLPEGEPT